MRVPTIREDDGCCWVEGDAMYINFRWCDPDDRGAVRYVVACTIHELVEHLLGMGHDIAERVERALMRLLER